MKKTILLLVMALFLLTSFSFAQSQTDTENKEKKSSFWFGPKVGVDLLTPTFDQAEIESQFKSNYSVGFFLQFGRKIYLQPEFYYVVQNEPIFVNGEPSNDETTVNSLRIPLMLGIKLIDLGIVSAHIMGGPAATFFLNESNPIANNSRLKNNFTLQFGAGVDVLGFITLDVRYSVNIDDSMEEQFEQFDWESGVNVTLGLKLR